MATEFSSPSSTAADGQRSIASPGEPRIYQLGLIGRGLSYSLSPAIFDLIAQQLNIKIDYRLYPLPHADEINDLLGHAFDSGVHGFNVTVPYKADVARLCGSEVPVNTITRSDKGYRGLSTDGRGFVASAELAFGRSIAELVPIAILGAGGAVSAILSELIQYVQPSDLRVFCRAADRCPLGENLPGVRFHPFHPTPADVVGTGLLVHATSLVGDAPELRWWRDTGLEYCQRVMDINYGERLTSVGHRANQRGLPAEDGLGMLVAQACLSAEVWFGRRPKFAEILTRVRSDLKDSG